MISHIAIHWEETYYTFTYFDMPKIQGFRKTQKPWKKNQKKPKTQSPCLFWTTLGTTQNTSSRNLNFSITNPAKSRKLFGKFKSFSVWLFEGAFFTWKVSHFITFLHSSDSNRAKYTTPLNGICQFWLTCTSTLNPLNRSTVDTLKITEQKTRKIKHSVQSPRKCIL